MLYLFLQLPFKSIKALRLLQTFIFTKLALVLIYIYRYYWYWRRSRLSWRNQDISSWCSFVSNEVDHKLCIHYFSYVLHLEFIHVWFIWFSMEYNSVVIYAYRHDQDWIKINIIDTNYAQILNTFNVLKQNL